MTREELDESLEYELALLHIIQTRPSADDIAMSNRFNVILDAARKQLALMPCGTCGGDGYFTEGHAYSSQCPACHGLRYSPETVEKIAKAVGEMFLYPDPHNEGNWMGPGIQAARQVAVVVLDALGETE